MNQFKAKGFKVVWFDGNRPAALKAFIERKTVSQAAFYLQMFNIEQSKVIQRMAPIIVNTFDKNGKFKDAATLLDEIIKAQ